jgi:diguanylate cyclase (GGDEF)-like protein
MAIARLAGTMDDERESRLRILVVEDSPAARVALEALLGEIGYVCESAVDGTEAIQMHRNQPYDVILSDWNMPHGDGMELCRWVRDDDGSARHTHFVLMTAYADKEHLVGGLRGGADDFVAKPIDLDELEARLLAAERVVRLHRKMEARTQSLRRDSERFFRAARLDPLTNVANRLQLDEDLPHFAEQAAARGGRACLAIADVDHFKIYNDTFGHPAGDGVLRRVAAAIQGSIRQSDSVYRYGGEEFVLFLREQSISEARVVIERVRNAVESLAIPNPGASGKLITISIGVAGFEATYLDAPSRWIEHADGALYRAKSLGRNRSEPAT